MAEEVEVAHARPARSLSAMQVPPSLQAVGVQVFEDPETGYRAVVIPPEVRQKVNVLMPVTSFAQADPNFTPSVRLVQLDPAVHAYEQAGRKLAPSKQGLEVLAQCAGILYSRADRIPRADLFEGQRYGYKGVIGIRRSDGTVEEISREYAWNEDAERAEIEEAVWKSARQHPEWKQWQVNGQKASPEQLGGLVAEEIRKRWLKELKDGAAKAESKSILRAIRAALQIPHTFTPQEFAKPFVVIGYSFTPNYDDPETKRLLVEHGLSARGSLYGQGSVEPRPENVLEAGESTFAPRTAALLDSLRDEREASPPPAPPSGPSPPAPPAPEFSGDEPGDEPEGELPEEDEIAAAAAMVLPDAFKKHAGKTIRQVYEADPGYVRWLASPAVRNPVVNAAAATFLAAAEGGVG